MFTVLIGVLKIKLMKVYVKNKSRHQGNVRKKNLIIIKIDWMISK